MPRSNWRIIIAVIGWLVLANAQPPQQHGNSSKDAHQAARTLPAPPPPETSTEKPPPAPYHGYESDPCYKAKDYNAANLCAQWRSAIAAEKAAHESRRATNWAIVATFLSAAGILGLIFTIVQGRRALDVANRGNRLNMRENARTTRRAVESAKETQAALSAAQKNAEATAKLVDTSEQNARRELRAYLDIEHLRLVRVKDKDTEQLQHGGVVGCLRNFGKTPAENITMKLTYGSSVAGRIVTVISVSDKGDLGGLSPTDQMHWKDFFGFPPPQWDDLIAGKWRLRLNLAVTYNDAFGQLHSIDIAFTSEAEDEDFSFVPGSRKIT